jgi:hypothetical protein
LKHQSGVMIPSITLLDSSPQHHLVRYVASRDSRTREIGVCEDPKSELERCVVAFKGSIWRLLTSAPNPSERQKSESQVLCDAPFSYSMMILSSPDPPL